MKDGIIYRRPRLIKKDKNMQIQMSLMKYESKNKRHVLEMNGGCNTSASFSVLLNHMKES